MMVKDLLSKSVDPSTVVSVLLHDGIHQIVPGSLRVISGDQNGSIVGFTPVLSSSQGGKGTFYAELNNIYGFHAIPADVA